MLIKVIKISVVLASCASISSAVLARSHQAKVAPSKELATPEKKTITTPRYVVQDHLMPQGLTAISDEQIRDHWQLYKVTVGQVNNLHEELAWLAAEGKGATLHYTDRRRRFGYEYNGMVLHEYYFGNLKAKQVLNPKSLLAQKIVATFGSHQQWHDDFKQCGLTRGIGWAILYLDPATDNIINTFIADHENGNIAGFMPLLVMDIWEHAYMVDHRAGGKAEYIDAFMQNIDWKKVEDRYMSAKSGKIPSRF